MWTESITSGQKALPVEALHAAAHPSQQQQGATQHFSESNERAEQLQCCIKIWI